MSKHTLFKYCRCYLSPVWFVMMNLMFVLGVFLLVLGKYFISEPLQKEILCRRQANHNHPLEYDIIIIKYYVPRYT